MNNWYIYFTSLKLERRNSIMSKNYSINEIAQILAVNRITVVRKIKDGSLKSSKQKNRRIISEEDLNAFLQTHPKYAKTVKPHPHQSDPVVDFIAANEAFNVYASFLKKLMVLPKNDDTIKYVLPMVENHKSLLDLVINELKEK